MRIISWNLWCLNKDQKSSVEKILQYHPDIVCLQEVNPSLMGYLETLEGYDLVSATDFNSFKKGLKKEYKLVILSKLKILNKDAKNKFNVDHLTRKSIWDTINRWEESMEFQYIDIESNGKKYRIFNVHLEVAAGPRLRLMQLDDTVKQFSNDGLNLICGDFNIYGRWWLNFMIGWAMGYRLDEYLVRERTIFEARYAELNLRNTFRNRPTYPKYRLQLDHILLPFTAQVSDSEVIQDVFGSDHYPIMIDFE